MQLVAPGWTSIGLSALAGALGWGIRGQYGHETGAMIAGLLVGTTLILHACPQIPASRGLLAVAWITLAIGIGGSMTYGQTVGLTHDAPLIGNGAALRWGMLGLALKGAIWIAFPGLFLGMALGPVRYRPGELALVLAALLLLCWIGIKLFNSPFDPAHKILPPIYFSDDWRWEPGADLKPRREVWGGLLCAAAGLFAYTGWRRRDPLAPRLGAWGALGGAIGFPLGQSIQATHAWHPEWFRGGIWDVLAPHINWWNMMETTFGAILGASLGLGVWIHRGRICADPIEAPGRAFPALAWSLLAIHLALLIGTEFLAIPVVDALYDFGLMLVFIPLVAAAAWPRWACLVILPMVAIPICGKTLRELAYKEHAIGPLFGWLLCVGLPLIASLALVRSLERDLRASRTAGGAFRPIALWAVWLFFILNFAFFRFPWPWSAWTTRTPNGLIFLFCAVVLTLGALRRPPNREDSPTQQPSAASP